MNTRLKTSLINGLKFLNTKPGFMRLFYWIHEIRKDEFRTDRFLSVELDEGFFMGTYKFYRHALWKRLAEETFEQDGTVVMKKMSPHYDYFIDIGAHIGYYTCLIHHTDPSKKGLAFEPNPENFPSLKKNIEINRIKNCKVFPIGLGDKKEQVIMYGLDAMASMVKETYDVASLPQDQAKVEIDLLDNFIKEIPPGANVFIKVDVEGNEFNMLKGAQKFFEKVKPVGLMMEVCPRWSTQDNPHYVETFTMLERLGYDVYAIQDGAKLKKFTDPKSSKEDNFVVIRKDMSQKIISTF